MRATYLDIVIALNEACSGRVNDAPLESGATRRRDRPQSCIPRGESEPLSPPSYEGNSFALFHLPRVSVSVFYEWKKRTRENTRPFLNLCT